ncbi:MAG TPA: hypothetical protein VNB94_03915 [Mycobacteriales bacterium]|nr:hypothetical protein [Mycobacteriales bacterium]
MPGESSGSREVLSWGPAERAPRAGRRLPWTLRRDRLTTALAIGVVGVLVAAGTAAAQRASSGSATLAGPAGRSSEHQEPMRAAVSISSTGAVVVAPVVRPSGRTARRAAELVAVRQCRNIERPRYRRVDAAADSASAAEEGRTATFLVGRASDTPRKSAGFVLRLSWREGEYVGQISEAYGGCESG